MLTDAETWLSPGSCANILVRFEVCFQKFGLDIQYTLFTNGATTASVEILKVATRKMFQL